MSTATTSPPHNSRITPPTATNNHVERPPPTTAAPEIRPPILSNHNDKAYAGAKWCKRHGWCNHATTQCRGMQRSKGSVARLRCLACKSLDHVYRDCPHKKKSLVCDNCLGPHLFEDCQKPFDPDVYFPTRRARIAKYPKKEEPETVPPAAVVGCLFTRNSQNLRADQYLRLLESAPGYLSLTFMSDAEGVRIGYGSELEAENASAALQEMVKKQPGLQLQCARLQGPAARSAPSTPSSGLTTPSSATSSNTTPWRTELQALDTKLTGEMTVLRTKQEDLSRTVSTIQNVQTQDSSTLRLVSIRMGVTPPDPNIPHEVALARAGSHRRPNSLLPEPVAVRPEGPATATPMEGIVSDTGKRKSPTEDASLRTRWLLCEPGGLPLHENEWCHRRVHLIAQRSEHSWYMTLVDENDTPEGDPCTVKSPIIATTEEEADSLLAQKIARVRTTSTS